MPAAPSGKKGKKPKTPQAAETAASTTQAVRLVSLPDTASPVKGFRVLRLPVASGSVVTRALLVKQHEGRTPEEKACADRTLFVTHLDGFVTEAQLKRTFAEAFGAVERLEYKVAEKKPQKVELKADKVVLQVIYARIVFVAASSLEKALAAATGQIAGAVLPSTGSKLKETLKSHRELYKDPAILRKEVDAWMANWDESQEQRAREARENAVDEDGFTKVISGVNRSADGLVIRAAKKASLPTGAFAEPINGSDALKDPVEEAALRRGSGTRLRRRKRTTRELPDFYRFQLRETKRQELVDHRKRKAVDAEKVAEMRKMTRKKKAVKTAG
mmetsp:Transcript_56902/g.127892  ORF Transcript_56902/g.127892 Transcript_56902/m.127892 type:complete len:331 (-) Transcript_56902:133-1125(-)